MFNVKQLDFDYHIDKPGWISQLADLKAMLDNNKLHMEIKGIPFNGKVAWGVYLTHRTQGTQFHGEGDTLELAVNKCWDQVKERN